jgi:proton glutamate symport protein
MTDAAPAPRRGLSPTMAALLALAAGLAFGLAAQRFGGGWQTAVAVVEPLGALWINAIRMVLVPLVVSLLIVSVASFADVRALGRLGARTVVLFLLLLAGTALFAALVAPPVFARMPVDAATAQALQARAAEAAASAAAAGEAAPELPTLRGFVVGLVPTNPLRAAVDGAMLPLVVFTLLFAVAVTRLPAASRALVTGFFGAVGDAMLVVVRWVLALTPVGVFALTAAMGAELGLGIVGPVGFYVVALCAMILVAGLALYPVAAVGGRIPLRTFARACAPAQAVAIGTRSSLASLPALIEGARRWLGNRPGITGFVLPLSVSTFKINTPIADLAGPLFLAHLYGVSLTPGQIATMTLVTVAMSFSNPGIPSGGLFVVTAPVMVSAGLPLEGIGLLIAADAIPDIFNTVINVTGDMAVAAMATPDAPLEPETVPPG